MFNDIPSGAVKPIKISRNLLILCPKKVIAHLELFRAVSIWVSIHTRRISLHMAHVRLEQTIICVCVCVEQIYTTPITIDVR